MSHSAEAGFPVHPLIAKLTEGNTEPKALPSEAPVKLSGYIGPASQSGMVRLYSTLRSLSHYIEFPENAVVHTRQTPETVLPDGATSLWLRKDTPVRWTREYPTASALAASITNSIQRQYAIRTAFTRRRTQKS
jgi:hypothetical protein